MTNKSPEHVLYTITKLNALICALQILYYIKKKLVIKTSFFFIHFYKYVKIYYDKGDDYIERTN